MIRKIIQINEDLCNGCGLCAEACHEQAIGMVDGKAKLLRDDYCDGLGDCLPTCPAGAISFVEREAAAYDEQAVLNNKNNKKNKKETEKAALSAAPAGSVQSRLSQWPVQIKLAPLKAPYFDNASLLIAADCTAFAYGSFHDDFIRGRITLVGCPKLDSVDYAEKLTEILRNNDIRDLTVVRMEVPCCGGIEHAARRALSESGKRIPWQVITIPQKERF
ncbi:4Fe-4S binding protein [Clostridium sp. AM58-1XD]|uniref:ATP-binding protein n=1 Tax=Clostridium sp. AM58-1XD TaxID=2292307 RepID=UPI000E5572CF|nr:4Fe-4S binding protein [Clostridium sp. AM58-1XD]RGZ01801.1 4Fe-4S ferredoxin [Clostridium sp. AM58-1XD]